MQQIRDNASRILIIYTGGTVGMVYDKRLQTLRPFEFTELQDRIPEMYKLGYHYFVHSFKTPIDSSDMNPDIWIKIVEIIAQNYNHYDGFVILHGTDTMAYTASALSYLLENLSKPVILTGSQLPIGEIRTDARENIITALEIAAKKGADGLPLVPEVGIFFDFKLFRGNRAKKYNVEKFKAFHSMNYPALAEAGVTIKYQEEACLPQPHKPLVVHKALDKNIAALRLFPGISQNIIEGIIHSKEIKGIILESFGAGNTPTAPWFLQTIKKAINNGKIVLNNSQCGGGSVSLGQYETSKYLKEIGVISGFDMTFEAAVTKLMFVLGLNKSYEETKSLLQKPLRGEFTLPS
ncbi:MAG TPA: asparaginase [Chitinophagaceae bacterium]|nr:asparaginase [Chitinophagaceae bacterium]